VNITRLKGSRALLDVRRYLRSKKILSNFWENLEIHSWHCVYHAAFQLEELADRAKRAASGQEFEQEFLNVGKAQTN